MNQEVRLCQNCKQSFTIEPEDFQFYEKMKVPPPTFCPECRLQRRLMFRNERTLYKRNCDLCGQNIISIFSPDKPFKVYCGPCWWSDKWDAMEYAQDYDPTRNFFEQFRELQSNVPCPHLAVSYTTLVNSEYINHAGYAKNCYLIFNSDYCENVHYGTIVNYVKDSLDNYCLGESELCYEIVNGGKLYQAFFSEDCSECSDIYFSKNLVGCNNCWGCVNLRNKSYHIFNESYPKKEYEAKVKSFEINSRSNAEKQIATARNHWLKYPQKFMHGRLNAGASGDYVYESKNAYHMYLSRFAENAKYSQFITQKPAKDIYDLTEWGAGVQRVCDAITVGQGVDNVKYCFACWRETANVEYSMFNIASQNILGCMGMRKKQYAILNKIYSEQEFEKLRARILTDLEKNPYVDSQGRVFKYGEFFPYDLSLFDYNESHAAQFFPLSEAEILSKGFRFREPTPTTYKITVSPNDIPDNILNTSDTITKEILECGRCGKAFRITPSELQLLRRFNLSAPDKCPDCRHELRMNRVNPPKLWPRTCHCSGLSDQSNAYINTGKHSHGANPCPNEFETSYAPERPEIVYCEQCYNAEVV